MLVLSRKPGEKVLIANDITISVLSVQGNRVRLGIDAPGDYRVLRAELANWHDSRTTSATTQSAVEQQPVAVGAVDNEPAWSI